MAERNQIVIGEVGVEDRIRPTKAWTVAAPPPNPVAGDMAYFSNGNAGAACWATYIGGAWKVNSTGSTISAT